MKCWHLFWIGLRQSAPMCVLWRTAGEAAALWGVFREEPGLQLSVINVFLQSRGYLLFTSPRNCSGAPLIFLICRDNFKMETFADPWLSPHRSWFFSATHWKPRERQESSLHFNILQLNLMLTLIGKVALFNTSNIYHISWLSCFVSAASTQELRASPSCICDLWFSFKLQFSNIDFTDRKETHCLTHVCWEKNHNHNQKVNTVIHVTLVTVNGLKHLCSAKQE